MNSATNIQPCDVTAIILAGGRGSRLSGQDKGLVKLQGQPIIEHQLAALTPQIKNIVINANRHHAEYARYGFPVIADTTDDFQGPLAGILAAMHAIQTPYLITLPCDAPVLANDYVQRMLASINTHQTDVAVAHDGIRQQPIHALLARSLHASLSECLASGQRKAAGWYAQHNPVMVDFSDEASMFDNMNTPEQLATLERTLDTTI